ncbi:mannose-1-phosphate guanylyltransferase/mannose-6-phosphate isomerase [Campylobacter concisus]|uniref:mannose-1-phosphate guanylyltransferase/mannose-6-phosphate isomerase n=1 Tax=Campylobacter concisus TaxID=199 RepID=UPI00122C2250|nr:mannose-1-phosphate guanylyltransferase/mannose-6-phosphate isomerase [Campylobacter concisus]
MTNILLCGGSGTRLWPISRTLMPKQFIKLFDDRSLFQLTALRNSEICDNTFVITNIDHYYLAMDQIENLNITNFKYLLEPVGRNTAPAITLACLALDSNEIVLVAPSDHLIKDIKAYHTSVKAAKELAEQNFLVTFGIKPRSPETGFGYIESYNSDVKAFYEKPDYEKAVKFLKDQNCYWNSGMFVFKAGVFLDQMKIFAPEILEACKVAFDNAKKDQFDIKIDTTDMQNIPQNSIDYAVMEKSGIVKMVVLDAPWSDLGSFDSLDEQLQKDINGNTINSDLVQINSHNNLVLSSGKKIALIDVDDLTVVDTKDALLISKKSSSQKVKNVVEILKEESSELCNAHVTTNRPWGNYTVLENQDGYKIKIIEVKPGKRLSLQKHFHRNEHWIVLSGSATVTIGETTRLVCPNESIYIKMGEVHRLSNEGKIPVVLIEAQVGEYTGEDDIIRLDDDFKR